MGYLQKSSSQAGFVFVREKALNENLNFFHQLFFYRRIFVRKKTSPIVESAVGCVFTELAAIPVRLDKQPGGDDSGDFI